ncbi:MAG: SWIM zinc finger family protein, partial [Pirellulales bacterium]|nr:SWIM zinc finger family protein [Pirellulales bacterium]
MSLVKRCKGQISSADWSKGQAYFQVGAVRRIHVHPTSLSASVIGTRSYQVVLNWSQALSRHILQVACSCPRFADMGICKHIAAMLLKADEQGFDQRVPGGFPLTVIDFEELDTADDDQLDDEDDGDDRRDEEVNFPGMTVHPQHSVDTERRSPKKTMVAKSELNRQFNKLARTFHEFDWQRMNAATRKSKRPLQTLFFVLDTSALYNGQLIIEFWHCPLLKNGQPGVPKVRTVDLTTAADIEDSEERELLMLLLHCGSPVYSAGGYYRYNSGISSRMSRLTLPEAMYDLLLPRLCATRKFGPRLPGANAPDVDRPLAWDSGPRWEFRLFTSQISKNSWKLSGELFRPGETLQLDQIELMTSFGLLLLSDRLARWNPGNDWPWVLHLRREGSIVVTKSEIDAAVEKFYTLSGLPPWELPAEWKWRQVSMPPQPCIRLSRPKNALPTTEFTAVVSFRYGEQDIAGDDPQAAIVDRAAKQVFVRDRAVESSYSESLRGRGFRRSYYCDSEFVLPPNKFMPTVERLIADHWHVEAEGQPVRTPGEFNISVTSGIDWFDLSAQCDFGGVSATLPELLAAVRRGQNFVMLGDGSRGMLPQEWLRRYSSLADLGQPQESVVRFTAPQAAILDALLAAQPKVEYDVAFTRIRRKLQQFDGIAPQSEPATFQGTLREYQREGLGWLHFLREFGYGGCLADDMGLGKTVQVLALLESRRKRQRRNGDGKNGRSNGGNGHRPSLAVVPKSLVFNWLDEAKRFTPHLRTCDFTGLLRGQL